MALISACVLRLSMHSLGGWAALSAQSTYLVWLVLSTVFAYHFTDETPVTRYLAWAALGGAGVTFVLLGRGQQYFALLSGGIWLGYILLLRARTWLKPMLVAAAWTVATHIVFSLSPVLAVHRFGWVLALTLCYDLADATYDRTAATATIPVAYGFRTTFGLGVVALAVTAGATFWEYRGVDLALQVAALLAAGVLLCVLALFPAHKAPWGTARYKLAADALLLA